MKTAKLLLMIALVSLTAACGAFDEAGSCSIQFRCDGSDCQESGTACATGDFLEDRGIDDQASCTDWAQTVAEDKGATLTSAEFDPEGDCSNLGEPQ